MFATIFGNLTAIIQRLYSTTSKYHKDLAIVREFINFYEIPSPLRDKLEDYTKNIWAQTKGVNVKKVSDFRTSNIDVKRVQLSAIAFVCYFCFCDFFCLLTAS
jgi:hypothetical protein